ncbi:MAG: hypothetical protein HYZ72_16160, partial [Deltaproteobacteria bacterium]|nr:hypothetical protein [Deltaproteobacteria bacterium]
DELRAIADDSLRYGDIARVPVWLAIETRALPLERHVVLKREFRHDLADAYLDRTTRRLVLEPPPSRDGLEWFRMHDQVVVRPERLTFAGQSRQAVRAAVAAIVDATSNPSLAGVIIHDLTGFVSLPE